MFVETRDAGKKKKYYLIYSYRVDDRVKRISRYLGSDLSQKELITLRKKAEELILNQAREKNIFEFELSEKEIEKYRRFEKPIRIEHLQKLNWREFTENFTYNTNAIEGSALALAKVKEIVEERHTPHNADELEAVGVAKAIDCIKKTNKKLGLELIKELHFLCFEKTKHFAGKLRNVEVVIRDSHGNIIHQGAPFVIVDKLLLSLANWYKPHKNRYPPLLLAALVHDEFENVHPFQDGNGRVGRLLLNYVLIKHNYPPINIRVKDRARYYKVLQAFEKKNNIKPTLKFLIAQYKKQYKWVSTK